MTKAVQSGTAVQTNSYDSNGNRVQQVAGSSTFTYSYQGLNILYEKNVTGSTTTVTKHFYAGGLQVAKMVGSSTYYLHQDALGSTRLVTTSTVSIRFSSNYVPYGNSYAMTGKEVFMYTGKPYDSATGLYYYGARYYDQSIGRFVTQDSYPGDRNDPMSMNLYIYARDNPERMVDPNGHMALRIDSEDDTKKSVPSTGVLFSSFNLQASIKASQVPVLFDMRKVSYTPSPVTVTVGAPTQSTDVTLTIVNGKNQYAPTVGLAATSNVKVPPALQLGQNLPPWLRIGLGVGFVWAGADMIGGGLAIAAATAPVPGLDVLGGIVAIGAVGAGLYIMALGATMVGTGLGQELNCGWQC